MSNTYHFIGIKGAGMSALALMLHQMGHTVQGSMLRSITLRNVAWNKQEFKFIHLMLKIWKATRSSLPGMLSVQITMWKSLMQMSMA